MASDCDFQTFSQWTQKQADLARHICYFKNVREVNSYAVTQESIGVKDPKGHIKRSQCVICNEERHDLDKCTIFIKSDVKKRWDLSSKANACFCCLKYHKGQCNRRSMCKIDGCEKFHHHLLHKTKPKPNVIPPSAFSGCSNETKSSVLLKIVPVKIHGPAGTREIVAFLDEGSTTTILDISVAREVGLHGKLEPFCFNWTGGVFRYESTAELASFKISGDNNKERDLHDVRLIHDLNLPTQDIDYEQLANRFPYVKIANVQSLKGKRPMLLIGQKHAPLIMSKEVVNINDDGPIVSKTKLGWVLHGPVNAESFGSNFTCCHITDESDAYESIHFGELRSLSHQFGQNKIAGGSEGNGNNAKVYYKSRWEIPS